MYKLDLVKAEEMLQHTVIVIATALQLLHEVQVKAKNLSH